jgi:O-antigen/teichoic acid export membrane protein
LPLGIHVVEVILYQRIIKFKKSAFIRNVATVATGTAAAQAISMIFSPIFTRLYGPDAYGLQGVFMSIAGILGSIAGMTYPVAIVLPKSDPDAKGLAWLSIYIGISMAVLVMMVLYFFGPGVLAFLQSEEIAPFMYLIPVSMFVSVVSAVLSQWLIRKKAFALTAKVTVWQMFIINTIKTGFGFSHPSAVVLIVSNTLGGLLGAGMMLLGLRRANKSHQPVLNDDAEIDSNIWALAKRHRDFPLLRTPQVLLNSLSHSLPIMMLATYFGPASVGFYSIASAVLGMPASLIGGSVMQVFYPRINEAIHRGEDAKSLIIKATVGLVLSGMLPFAIVIVAGPTLFGLVFGQKWQVAGVYAQWLSIWLFLQYINKPAVAAIPALRLQGGLLIYELFSTGTKVLALYLGFIYFKSDIAAIALFSVFGVIAYAWLILWVINHSGKFVAQSRLEGVLR